MRAARILELIICVSSCFPFHAAAQTPGQSQLPLTDREVVKMTKAGVAENNILRAIQAAPCDFDLSVEALIQLKAEAVPDNVVTAMQNCQSAADKAAAAHAKYVVPKESALHGVATESRMVTLSQLKEQYPGILERDKQNQYGTDSILHWQFGKSKVIISDVAQGSPAARAGIQSGDLVNQIVIPGIPGSDMTRWTVATEEDFRRFSSECKPDCLVEVDHRGLYAGEGWTLVGSQERFELVQWMPGCFNYRDKRTGNGWEADLGEAKNRACDQAAKAMAERLPAKSRPQPVTTADSERLSQTSEIGQEIQKIRNAPHEVMPPAQATGASLGGETSMTVQNGTTYLLYIYLSGPISQKLDIVAGGSQTLHLPPGHYEIAAKVSDPSVIPFYGIENYAPNMGYSSHFYIATQPR